MQTLHQHIAALRDSVVIQAEELRMQHTCVGSCPLTRRPHIGLGGGATAKDLDTTSGFHYSNFVRRQPDYPIAHAASKWSAWAILF